jgi:sortase (surface protein transpeptidase)
MQAFLRGLITLFLPELLKFLSAEFKKWQARRAEQAKIREGNAEARQNTEQAKSKEERDEAAEDVIRRF